MNDILEVLYLFSRRVNLGPIDKDMSISENEIQMVDEYSKNIDMQDIGLFWQLTIKTIDDLRIIGNENLTLEMYIMQLMHLRNLREEGVRENTNIEMSEKNNLIGKKIDEKNLEQKIISETKNQLKSTNQIKTSPIKSSSDYEKSKIEITSFQDIIDQSTKEKEIELKFDLRETLSL